MTKSIETRLHLKRRLYYFQLKRGFTIDDHMNNYTKLLADLVNVDVVIEEEDKALILLNSLPDEEYETFILTLFNGKQSLNYSNVSAAFVNYKVRRKDKQSSSSSIIAEVMTARGMSSNHRKSVMPRFPKYAEVKTRRESATHIRKKNTSRIRAKS